VIALVAALFVASPSLVGGTFTLDDGWITQVVSRNLAGTGVWGFEYGRPSSGATSILWTLLVTPAHLVHADPVAWTVALAIAALVGTCIALHALLRADGLAPAPAALAALLPAAFGNAAWLTTTGLEATLLMFLSVLAVVLHRRGSSWTGIVCGVLVLTRPDGVAVPLVLATLTAWRRRSARATWSLMAPSIVALGATAAVSWWTAGGLLPTTLDGRRWLYGFDEPSWRRPVTMALAWNRQLHAEAWRCPAAAWAALVMAIAVGGAVVARRRGALALLMACAAAHAALYAVLLPFIGQGGRYQPLLLVLAPVLAALGGASIARAVTGRRSSPATLQAISASLVLASCVPTLIAWRSIASDGVDQIRGVHGRLASWIRQNVPAGAPVAAFDIGMIGYFGGHPIVDLGGLVDRAYLPYLYQARVGAYLRERGARFVALPMGWSDADDDPSNFGVRLHLFDSPGTVFLPVAAYSAPAEPWWRVIQATSHFVPCQVLYLMLDGSPTASQHR
jgi:hypothetical protein